MTSIVFIITSLRRTGPVNILFDLITSLDRSVYRPHILTLCNEDGDSRWCDFVSEGVSLRSLNLPKGWRFIAASARIKTEIDNIRPAVVHCFGFRADMVGTFYLKNYEKVSSQLNYPFDDYVMTYGKVVGGIMAQLTVLALRRDYVAVACSKDVAAKLKNKGVRSRIVYNAINDARFIPLKHEERSMQRKNLKLWSDAEFIFIFVGVLSERKQPLIALQAFLNFQAIHPKSAMLVLGEGPLDCECRNLVSGARVVFYGNVVDTLPYLAASNAYIATSKAEGMPVSVLEAMAMQLPVVLSNIEPHREILSIESGAGFLTATGSVIETTNAMLRLADEDLDAMGKSSRSIIDKELNAGMMSKKYQKIYGELAGKKSRIYNVT